MTSPILSTPRKLEKGDRPALSSFSSGAEELDGWLQTFAWENQAANNAITYVATLNDGTIVGLYALCSSAVRQEHAPAEFARRRPKDIPCILLPRLAVDQRFQGHRIGQYLLRDALTRAIAASESIGAACLLIHARNESAKAFYLRQGEFQQSPVDGLHLVLPLKMARKQLGLSGG